MTSEFQRLGFQVIPKVIHSETADILAEAMRVLRGAVCAMAKRPTTEASLGADDQVSNAFASYGAPVMEGLLTYVKPYVEEVVNRPLLATYAYSRIYFKGAELERHVDRGACEVSMTVTLAADREVWPIYMQGLDGVTHELKLQVGQGCVYKGLELDHWRTPYEGTEHVQVFLHYVYADGAYAHLANDTRPALGTPSSMKQYNA